MINLRTIRRKGKVSGSKPSRIVLLFHLSTEALSMRIGVVFPQTEIGADPYYIKDYGQTAEALGFSHILA